MRRILLSGGIHEKHLAAGIARRTPGVMAALGHQFPLFLGEDNVAYTRCTRPGLNRLGPIFPKKAHGFRKIIIIAGAVSAVDDAEAVIVTRESQGLVHFLIDQEPVSGAVFHIARAGGQIGANRFGLELADKRGKLMTAAKSDEAAAVGIDAAECVGTLPCRIESRNAAAAAACDTTIVAAGG